MITSLKAFRTFVPKRALHTLPTLPYDISKGLGDVLSPKALDFHYNKHHQAYITKTNDLIKGTIWEKATLEEIILGTANDASSAVLFNNAAQVWNHTFFWHCMTPTPSAPVSSQLSKAIEKDFGSVDAFKEQFSNTAAANFGSGWTWLVYNRSKGALEIKNSSNAGNPVTDNRVPLLTVDVWEHSYYLDHQNRRPEYLKKWWSIVNWDFVSKNFEKASSA
eukprot:TRINITY_DN1725_c0_g1_i1.p1 TRINITY_DN1725_c0_g1~~TRINITY_DN1725_c0_g1_i1.p1  ORF type:complete len:220 (-),score=46.14 TRINITY_DN1725_c0_g1_i1:109-768(-)